MIIEKVFWEIEWSRWTLNKLKNWKRIKIAQQKFFKLTKIWKYVLDYLINYSNPKTRDNTCDEYIPTIFFKLGTRHVHIHAYT